MKTLYVAAALLFVGGCGGQVEPTQDNVGGCHVMPADEPEGCEPNTQTLYCESATELPAVPCSPIDVTKEADGGSFGIWCCQN